MLLGMNNHYLVSFTDDGKAFITNLQNVEIYSMTDCSSLTERPIIKTEVKGQLTGTKIIDCRVHYKNISDEEIINLIKE